MGVLDRNAKMSILEIIITTVFTVACILALLNDGENS